MKNRLNKDIKRDKMNRYHDLFKNAKNDMRKSWNIIKSLLGTNIKKSDAKLIFDDALTGTDRVDSMIFQSINSIIFSHRLVTGCQLLTFPLTLILSSCFNLPEQKFPLWFKVSK